MDNVCGMITPMKVSEERIYTTKSGLSHILIDGARGIKTDRTSLDLAGFASVQTLSAACY